MGRSPLRFVSDHHRITGLHIVFGHPSIEYEMKINTTFIKLKYKISRNIQVQEGSSKYGHTGAATDNEITILQTRFY